MWTDDLAVPEIQRFLSGEEELPVLDSILTTVLFTGIVGSTGRAAALGDRAWRDLLGQHHATVRRELTRFHGHELDTADPSEVVVSSTVQDLVAGSGIAFDDRGVRALKDVPGEWRLFAAQQ
jgi:class 3 adenylate cyclase